MIFFLTNSTEDQSVIFIWKSPAWDFGIFCSSEAFQIICYRLRSNLTAGENNGWEVLMSVSRQPLFMYCARSRHPGYSLTHRAWEITWHLWSCRWLCNDLWLPRPWRMLKAAHCWLRTWRFCLSLPSCCLAWSAGSFTQVLLWHSQ